MKSDKDYEQFHKLMMEKFPDIFSNNIEISVGPGWWPIIEKLCDSIQHHLDWNREMIQTLTGDNPHNDFIPEEIEDVEIVKIIEKLGGLRIYYTGGDAFIEGLVEMAKKWANQSCEECGNIGTRHDIGRVKTLCSVHEKEYSKKYA